MTVLAENHQPPAENPSEPRTRRHPMTTVTQARQMYQSGWTQAQIARLLGLPHSTVGRWVVPGKAERENYQRTVRHARATADSPVKARPLCRPRLDEQMLTLRRRGLSYEAIAVVAHIYHGVRLDAESIRSRLRSLGVAPHPVRSKAMRRLNAQRANNHKETG